MIHSSKRCFLVAILFLCCLKQKTYSQIGTYTKVHKVSRKTYNFLSDTNARKRQYKDKGVRVVYSDRSDNNTYLDNLGLKQGEQQRFLTPYFVIDETDDFLELVKFDPTQLGKPKGVFSLFYGSTYNFQDVKNATYVGWMQKNKLLHFSYPKISESNLNPVVYLLGGNDLKTLINFRKYVQKDSVKTYTDPKLKVPAKKSFNTNQFVYLYKYNINKTAALISNKKHIHASDSLERVMGWVPVQLIKNIGQRKVWNTNRTQNIVFTNPDSTKYVVKSRDIKGGFLFQPEGGDQQSIGNTDTLAVTTHIPLTVWNHYGNKLINIMGSDVSLEEAPLMKKENKTCNIHFIFDCSDFLRAKLLRQITSLQRIGLLVSEDPRFKDFNFTFSASSFGCNSYYEFPKNDSFTLWIDYLQKVFLNDPSIETDKYNFEGVEKCLYDMINVHDKSGDFENNIVLIAGEKNLEINFEGSELFYELSRSLSRLLFFQLENTADNAHQDFVLKSKRVLKEVSGQYRAYMSDFIIENKNFKKEDFYTFLPSDTDNIYLLDAPEYSLYTGGIVFPKINQNLTPLSFDIAVDSLLSKTIKSNDVLLSSLEKGSEKLGFLRSKPTSRISKILKKDSINPLFVPKINKDQVYLETSRIDLKENKQLEAGYLFTKEELSAIIESYRSVVPLIDKNVTTKQRRALYKKYKTYYKQLNKLLFYKELKRSSTVGKLVKVKTGIDVNNVLLNEIKIPEIKRKSKLSHEAYTVLMKSLHDKVLALELILESATTQMFVDGSNENYYYVPENKLF